MTMNDVNEHTRMEDRKRQMTATLFAAAPALLDAATRFLCRIETITLRDFAIGGDAVERLALRRILEDLGTMEPLG